MPDGNIPPRFDHIHNMVGRFDQRLFLVFHRNALGIFINELPPTAMTATFLVMAFFS